MICFQTLYLRSLIPTAGKSNKTETKLWFAFKLCIYVLWYQLSIIIGRFFGSCDLLSNFVFTFFDTNCRHDWKTVIVSCDLLSNFVFTFFDTNCLVLYWMKVRVVICFQTLYLRSLIPTHTTKSITYKQLWFAFKLCIYVLWYQQPAVLNPVNVCCDLLSNFVFTFFDTNLFF